MVLELARPSEAQCFPPAGDFFEAVLLQQPQATEAVEKCCFSRISDDTLGCRKCCFSRISDDTLGIFWRGFGTSSSFRGMVFSFRQVIFSKLFYCSSRRQQKLSKNVVVLGFQTTH